MARDWSRLVEEWEAYGLKCRIAPGLLGFCGYVQLPARLIFGDSNPQDVLEAHWGVNYGPDEDGWIGFDTMHAGDYWAPDDLLGYIDEEMIPLAMRFIEINRHGPGGRRWTIAALKEATERVAQQVAVALDLVTPVESPESQEREQKSEQ